MICLTGHKECDICCVRRVMLSGPVHTVNQETTLYHNCIKSDTSQQVDYTNTLE